MSLSFSSPLSFFLYHSLRLYFFLTLCACLPACPWVYMYENYTTQFMTAITNGYNNNCWIMFAVSRPRGRERESKRKSKWVRERKSSGLQIYFNLSRLYTIQYIIDYTLYFGRKMRSHLCGTSTQSLTHSLFTSTYLLLLKCIYFCHNFRLLAHSFTLISIEFIDLMSTKCNYLLQLIHRRAYNRVKWCDFVERRVLIWNVCIYG